MVGLVSFKNDPNLKAMFLAEIIRHREADQIVKGTYGTGRGADWRGCAVGCSVRSLNIRLGRDYSTWDYSAYERELGISQWLARLEDIIFEGLPLNKAVLWPEQFTEAVPVGVNLEPVRPRFCAFLMQENIERVGRLPIADDLKQQVVGTINGVLALHLSAIETGQWDESAAESARLAGSLAWAEPVKPEAMEWSSAESAAWRTLWFSAKTARCAAESPTTMAAVSAAAMTAVSATESEWHAAWLVAWSLRRSSGAEATAAARGAATAAATAAKIAAYERYAAELLRILRSET